MTTMNWRESRALGYGTALAAGATLILAHPRLPFVVTGGYIALRIVVALACGLILASTMRLTAHRAVRLLAFAIAAVRTAWILFVVARLGSTILAVAREVMPLYASLRHPDLLPIVLPKQATLTWLSFFAEFVILTAACVIGMRARFRSASS